MLLNQQRESNVEWTAIEFNEKPDSDSSDAHGCAVFLFGEFVFGRWLTGLGRCV